MDARPTAADSFLHELVQTFKDWVARDIKEGVSHPLRQVLRKYDTLPQALRDEFSLVQYVKKLYDGASDLKWFEGILCAKRPARRSPVDT